MIPIELQDVLREELQELFRDKHYMKPNGELGYLNIYTQDIPYKKSMRDTDHYPFIVIAIEDGDINEENNCNLAILIGTYDEGEDRQGYRDATSIANKIMERLPIGVQRIKYQLQSMRYAFPSEETNEYSFITLGSVWEIPQYTQTDPLI